MTKSYGIGRGNWTSGVSRRGQRGRPPLVEPVTTTTVKLSDRHIRLARYLGRGSMAEGLRIALNAFAPFLRNPDELWWLLASTGKHFDISKAEGQRCTLPEDIRQALDFLERAAADSPAGREREGDVPKDLFTNVAPAGETVTIDDPETPGQESSK